MVKNLMPELATLWSAERLLMRLEALLSSMPAAAVHWRCQAGLIEAVRSTELNDHILDPSTLLLALMQQQAARNRSDAGAVRLAESIWHAMVRASGSAEDFVATATIGGGGLLTVDAKGASVEPIRRPERMEWALEKIEHLGRCDSLPLLPRLAIVPQILREISGQPSPVAERLWIVMADQKWRRPNPLISAISKPKRMRGTLLLEQPNQARWVVGPASLLSARGPGIWNPSHPAFLERFVGNAEAWLRRQLDSLLSIARWEANQLTSFAHSGPDGARVRLAQMIAHTPILDAALVAQHLQVHERTARRLLNEAAEAGVIVELMGRYRIWAAPSLAQWARSTQQDRRQKKPKATRSATELTAGADCARPSEAGWEEDRAEKDARLQALMDNLETLSKRVLDLSKQTTTSVAPGAS